MSIAVTLKSLSPAVPSNTTGPFATEGGFSRRRPDEGSSILRTRARGLTRIACRGIAKRAVALEFVKLIFWRRSRRRTASDKRLSVRLKSSFWSARLARCRLVPVETMFIAARLIALEQNHSRDFHV